MTDIYQNNYNASVYYKKFIILSGSVGFLVTKETAVVKRISQRNLCSKKRYFRPIWNCYKYMFQNDNNLISYLKFQNELV